MKKTLSVVIPVYNEEKTLADILEKVYSVNIPGVDMEILVVNDGSTDSSALILENWIAVNSDFPGKRIVTFNKPNGGKGSAVREGIRLSTGNVVIIQDADLEYDPNDYAACITPILNGEVKVVYGSREDSIRNRFHSSLLFYFGAQSLSFWINLLFNSNLTDEPTCYKTFDGDLIRSIPLEGNRFEWEPEITAKLLRLGYQIKEVDISYYPRSIKEGKKIRFRDGIEGFWMALKWRFLPLAKIAKKISAVSKENALLIRDAKNEQHAFYFLICFTILLHFLMAGDVFSSANLKLLESYPVSFFNPEKNSFVYNIIPVFNDMSFYPFIRDIIESAFGYRTFLIFQLLIGALTVIPIYLTARLLIPWKYAFFAGLLFVPFPVFPLIGVLPVPDTIFVFLLAIQIFFLLRFLKSRFGLFFFASVFFTAVATLIFAHNVYWLIPALILLFCMKSLPVQLKFNYLIFTLIVAAIVILPFHSVHFMTSPLGFFDRVPFLPPAVLSSFSKPLFLIPFIPIGFFVILLFLFADKSFRKPELYLFFFLFLLFYIFFLPYAFLPYSLIFPIFAAMGLFSFSEFIRLRRQASQK